MSNEEKTHAFIDESGREAKIEHRADALEGNNADSYTSSKSNENTVLECDE